MTLTDYISEHQTRAGLFSIGGYLTGKGAGYLYSLHIPPIFLEGFQIMAYTGSILVAVLTIWTWVAKRVKK